MDKCLIVFNQNAGKCNKCSPERVKRKLADFDCNIARIPDETPINFDGYQHVAVCGGDGTLSTVMQKIYNDHKTIYYFPCGTLNDKAKAETHAKGAQRADENGTKHNAVVGKIGDRIFTYVFATGAFTPIGYTTEVSTKKRLGALAYVLKVFQEFKPSFVNAKISTNGKCYKGNFNLIMFIKSPRCFGFRFNKGYDDADANGHLVLIRSPHRGGFVGRFQMFFPFFRVFFLGLKKERDGKIVYTRFSDGDITLTTPTAFCVDGEKEVLKGKYDVSFLPSACKIIVRSICE